MKTLLFALILTYFPPSGKADVTVIRSHLTSAECIEMLRVLKPDSNDHAVTSCAFDEGF